MARKIEASEVKLEWSAPPGSNDPVEYAAALEGLKERPNEWARLRVWPADTSGGYAAKKRLTKVYPDDYEFLARKQADGTVGLYGRYIADET